MILRRITQHVKDQNWFAVGLDFFIVVAGILIALQITNWSEEHENRASERQIIDRLYADFEALSSDTQGNIDFMMSIVDGIKAFEQIISNYPENADIQRITDFYQTSFYMPRYAGQSDTYEQLVASGDMSLLSNHLLLTELVRHATLTSTMLHQDQAVREWSRPYFTPLVRLRALIDVMPMEDAVSKSGSRADLIVAVSTYQKVFDAQLSAHEIHQASFTKLLEILAKEKSDHG
jgi:hypothetical protein